MTHPMRIGSGRTFGKIVHAAKRRGTRHTNDAVTNPARDTLPCRISLTNCAMKHIWATAKPPICPSKLPATPIASPMVQNTNPHEINRGSKPIPPNANMAAGNARRILKIRDASFAIGKKYHNAARRKMTATIYVRILDCFVIIFDQ